MKIDYITIGIIAMFILATFFLFGCLSLSGKKDVSIPSGSSAGGKYDGFAKCLSDRGVKFYGAFWCSHCDTQKELFGNSIKDVNYIECSLPDRSAQTSECAAANIKGYPTWEFADGSRQEGELTLKELSLRSGCKLA